MELAHGLFASSFKVRLFAKFNEVLRESVGEKNKKRYTGNENHVFDG